MYSVVETRSAEKELDKAPKEIQAYYEFWKNIAEISGVLGIKRYPGFKDHALKGEWSGARSSYLNNKWRVIYWQQDATFVVTVVRITAHDYRRK